MFSSISVTDTNSYNFLSEQNAPKWKGILLEALQKVQRQVNPSLSPKDDALAYIEELIFQLLSTLCFPHPHSPQDVEDRVQKTFPDPIDKWAIKDAQKAMDRPRRNLPLVLPVDKLHHLLMKEVLGYRVDFQVTVYIVAVLEYIAADIMKLTGNYVRNIKHHEITSQDIQVAICADQVLMDMFSQERDESLFIDVEPIKKESLTYEEIVKDFILEETQYMRDLNMLIKVFRAPFAALFPKSKFSYREERESNEDVALYEDLEVIFSNLLDVYEFTANLLSSVEDQVEVAEEDEAPMVATCFEDHAEAEEFSVYERYVDDMLAPNGKERLYTLLQRGDVMQKLMEEAGPGFKDAMKYVLPKLLLGPIYHCLHYFEVLNMLFVTSPNEEDKEILGQVEGLLQSLKAALERKFSGSLPKRKPWELSLRLQGPTGRQAVLAKMTELQKSIDGWEGKDIWQSCSEFIMEGVLNKYTGKKATERHVFLFDGLIILCKQNTRRSSVTGPMSEYKLKEKYFIRKVEIADREDMEDYKNIFEIRQRVHTNRDPVFLCAKTAEEKSNWMAALMCLQTRSMLERKLDGILKEEEKKQPLKLPDPSLYRFSVPDSPENVVFEENHESSFESPLMRGGTILKLVERLTYHTYADPKFVKTFLTTYRSFCSPHELMDLLIERYEIPDPIHMETDLPNGDVSLQIRDDFKRFKKEYVKPVQFRVVNVLRQWVDHHFYDFERDKSLLDKALEFLENVKGKAMKKMAESTLKVIHRRRSACTNEREFKHQTEPPAIEWHIARNKEEFELMNLHPIEIARQVTLLEFDMYAAVKPSELIGNVWMKKDKNKNSPNLLKMIHFSTNFTYWLEKCIVETENLEERVCVMSRVIEIMLVFLELNNFNGVLEVVGALNSAPVHRLEYTKEKISDKYVKAFDEAKELNSDHFKKYVEKLRSINPPCVPFLGMYLTNILHIEDGNLDFLPKRPTEIINFSKRRKLAEITAEIQQYQNQRYCLQKECPIIEFFEKLNPMEGMEEKKFLDIIFYKSLEIEPRNMKPPKFPKRFDYPLKSPGIKPGGSRHGGTGRGHTLFGSYSAYTRITEEDSDSTSPICTTPTTPLTPPPSGSNDNSVFAQVLLGPSTPTSSLNSPSVQSSMTSSVELNLLDSISSDNELLSEPQPPPLPPRRRNRESTSSDVFHVPPLPPPPRSDRCNSEHFHNIDRFISDRPPPIPPRRDSMFGTMPRAQSMSLTRVGAMNTMTSTLPRRNSERSCQSPTIVNCNGDSDDTPELPPRHHHARKRSS